MPPSTERPAKASLVRIDAERAGQRIDNFLLSHLKGVPRSRIYRILRKGEVRVNKGRIKADYRLRAGDEVRIPPVRVGEPPSAATPGRHDLKRIETAVLYEDPQLLVINKPAGMAVHGGSGISYGVIEALRALRPEASSLELVHRLDRDTSGCLVIAKKRSALRRLHALFRGEGMEKHYTALLAGAWSGGARAVDAPLRKNQLKSGERMVRVSPDGKAARSYFTPRTRYNDATLVDVLLATGRTHQIRVHAAHIGHPIAGDDKYGDAAFNRHIKRIGLKRLFLHAASISFELEDGPRIDVQAPLDPELEQVLTRLTENDKAV